MGNAQTALLMTGKSVEYKINALVVKSVDTRDLKSLVERRASSSLARRTKIHGELAELVEGTFLLRRHTGKNLYQGFESLTLRQLTKRGNYG